MIYSFQIKRLRTEDPLEALIVRGSKRKSRDADDACNSLNDQDHTFRLAKTFQSQQPGNTLQAAPELDGSATRRFCLPKQKRLRRNSVDSINEEVMDGASNAVETNSDSQKGPIDAVDTTPDKETEDYVYDVYFNSQSKSLTDTRIGYIDLDKEDEKLFFEPSDTDEENKAADDDQDSNAESFYLNDYPDEEEYGDSSDNLSDSEFVSADRQYLDELSWDEESDNERDATYERYGWRQ